MLSSTPVLASGAGLAGAGATIAVAFFHRDAEVSNIGLTVLAVGAMLAIGSFVCRALARVNRPADAAFEEGYQMGLDAGYREARRSASGLTVVQLPTRLAAGDS